MPGEVYSRAVGADSHPNDLHILRHEADRQLVASLSRPGGHCRHPLDLLVDLFHHEDVQPGLGAGRVVVVKLGAPGEVAGDV
eukprot:scaffold173306_cov43-Prasinocladus_malaysianus.AAC.1